MTATRLIRLVATLAAVPVFCAAQTNNPIQEMNKRELILNIIKTDSTNDYVPCAFFTHFRDRTGQQAVKAHSDFYKATGMDFVKVSYEIVVPRININKGSDWAKVPVYDEAFFESQLDVVEGLARKYKQEALIIPTVYSPLALACQTIGYDKRSLVRKYADEDPAAFSKAIHNLALSLENYMRAAVHRGADGFYISSQGADGQSISTKVWNGYVRKWDKYVSEVASSISQITILHICDFHNQYRKASDLYAYADYPVSIINVPMHFADGTVLNLKEAEQHFNRPIFGGLDRKGILVNGNIDEIKAEVDKVMKSAPQNFILGADCTISNQIDYHLLHQVIDYAHTWRQSHK